MHQDKSATQWHPLFAELLRPLLQDQYDVQTNVPVGDVPREADILLLRRTTNVRTPFHGLWRNLTEWNILEFKGPSVDARVRDLSLLVEVGLGVYRKLSAEQTRQRRKAVHPEQASFWYVVRTLGRRLQAEFQRRLGRLEETQSGLWRSQVLGHPILLVSSETLASEAETVPLHLLVKRSPDRERELARLIVDEPHYLQWYGEFLGALHPEAWTEVKEMARKKEKNLEFDISAIIEDIDMKKLVESGGFKHILQSVGARKAFKEMGVDWFVSNLPPEDLRKLKERLK